MLKLYANLTSLNEHDISERSLTRLRVIALLSLPFTPLFALLLADIPLNMGLSVGGIIILLISGAALFLLCMNKLVNRVWVRDQYLDEWDLKIKHGSMAFAFQVVLYAICIILTMGFVLYTIFDFSFPKITVPMSGYVLYSLMMLGLYAQIYTQLEMVQPIEEDDLDANGRSARPLKHIIIKAGLIFGLFLVVPFSLGFLRGYKNAHAVANLADEAKSVCEARGSTVHWVSIKKDKTGFGCHDENTAAPEHSKVTEPSP